MFAPTTEKACSAPGPDNHVGLESTGGSEDVEQDLGFQAVGFSYSAEAAEDDRPATENPGSEGGAQEPYQPPFEVPMGLRTLLRGVTDHSHKVRFDKLCNIDNED